MHRDFPQLPFALQALPKRAFGHFVEPILDFDDPILTPDCRDASASARRQAPAELGEKYCPDAL